MTRPLVRVGAAFPVTSSSSSPREGWRLSLPVEALLLVGAGVAVALLHESFRWPLRMPGHHGLEWLAVLMAARLLSGRRWAALGVALGAAATAASGVAGHDALLRPAIYLLQGLALDSLWGLAGAALMVDRPAMPWRAALTGGAVHALSPLAKWLIAAAGGAQAGALAQGLALPLSSHLAFGALGAAAGALAVMAWRRSARR